MGEPNPKEKHYITQDEVIAWKKHTGINLWTGKVDDYLEYKGIQICYRVMEHWRSDAGTEVRRSESDNGYGNGAICCSDRRV